MATSPTVNAGIAAAAAMSVVLHSAACDDGRAIHDPTPSSASGAVGEGVEGLGADGELLVYERTRHFDADGGLLSEVIRGDLTEEISDRAARPWSYRQEPLIFNEDAWSVNLDDGAVERGYRITSRPNDTPVVVPPTSGPPVVGERLIERLKTTRQDEQLAIRIRLRNYPEWDIPLPSSTKVLTIDEADARAERRGSAISERQNTLEVMGASTLELIASYGGQVRGKIWGDGLILAEMPAAAVRELVTREDLEKIDLVEGKAVPLWPLGDGRTAERLGADTFIDAGFDGDEPQPTGGRHSYTTIAVGVIELGVLEDEACFFDDNANCNGDYNLAGRYMCNDSDSDGNPCEPPTGGDLPDADGSDVDSHATYVTAALAANYRQGRPMAKQSATLRGRAVHIPIPGRQERPASRLKPALSFSAGWMMALA